ncbi:hypothetical protein JXJ21_18280 [candidate division KSB1 bacterium]|nr:hypothetical protein [candidate division KSB1 bacterium]
MIVAIKMSMTRFRSIERERKISAIITIAILSLLYLFLRLTSLPESKYEPRRYDKIEWTKYQPRQLVKGPSSKPTNSGEKTPDSPTNSPQIEKIDLTKIAENFSLFGQPNKITQELHTKNKRRMKSNGNMNVNSYASSEQIFFPLSSSSILDFGSNRLPITPTLNRYIHPRLKVKQSQQRLEREDKSAYVLEEDFPEVNGKESEALVIPPIPLEEIPKDVHRIMPKIFIDLSKWMANNHTELPEVVKKFMGYDSLDLASQVKFKFKGRDFNLFLLCRESILEIRICLLEENHVTMLIDKGFKKKSHFLRIGNVNRKDDKILSFGTTRESPSEQRTQDFYQVFLSWWQSVEKNQS